MLAHNLGAHRTLARINNYEYLLPKNKELFEKLGINSMIYPEMLAAKEIVTAVRRPWTRQYWELFGGALILIGVKVRDNSRLVNRVLAELLNEQKLYHIVAIKLTGRKERSGSKEGYYYGRKPYRYPCLPIFT